MTNETFTIYKTAKIALFLSLVAVAPTVASAQPRCSVLEGSYAFTFSGTMPVPGPPAIVAPFAGVGIITFDGAGRFTQIESASFPGFVLRSVTQSGTYTLNANCTGTATLKFPDGTSASQDFVMSNSGKTIYGVGVDNGPPGTSLVTTFTKLTPGQ